MPIEDILEFIDHEISQLQRARTLLAGDPVVEAPSKRRGRPRGSSNKPQAPRTLVPQKPAKRTMSSEGKARIAAAQMARWAKQKKAAATPKKTESTSTSGQAKTASVKRTSLAKKRVAPAKSISTGKSASPSLEESVV